MNTPTLPPLIDAFYRRLVRENHPAPVRLIETHISWVILAGNFAYKIKKPVDFGFLDFSTLDKRRFYCQEELRLNRRLAPDLYLDVIDIGDAEPPLEYAIKLKRFDDDALAGALAEHGQLSPEHIDGLADTLAAFHQAADRAGEFDTHGLPEAIESAIAHNFPPIADMLTDPEDLARLRAIQTWAERQFECLRPTLLTRKREGHIRECHGDLHLGNLVAIDGRLVPFDCIEFSEDLRWIDTLSELAFIVMDLEVRILPALAWRLLNRYLSLTGDYAGLAVFDYYRVYRATVRAKIACLTLQQAEPAQASLLTRQCLDYLDYATRIIHKPQPILLITHGLSGCGKSYLAMQLAEALPAIRVASDIERKRLAGFGPTDKTNTGVYSTDMTVTTYEHLRACAAYLLRAGQSAIVDATFLKVEQRARFRELAADEGVTFAILDLDAPQSLLKARIETRMKTGADPSEATLDVLAAQCASAEPLTEAELKERVEVDASRQPNLLSLLGILQGL